MTTLTDTILTELASSWLPANTSTKTPTFINLKDEDRMFAARENADGGGEVVGAGVAPGAGAGGVAGFSLSSGRAGPSRTRPLELTGAEGARSSTHGAPAHVIWENTHFTSITRTNRLQYDTIVTQRPHSPLRR